MKQYQDLLQHILDHGVRKENRTGIDTISVFGHQMRFNLADGFPLVTTKKVHIKSIIYELLWMLNGDTNVKFLQDNGVTIWDEWAQADYRPELGHEAGELGPVYGKQWREWQTFRPETKEECDLRHHAHFDGGGGDEILTRASPFYEAEPIDQIARAVDLIFHNPQNRRIIVSSWNVARVPEMKLPPCHLLAQFGVTQGRLSCHMYIRSWDVFLGGPFNIAQYAFLTHMLAHSTGLGVGDLIISSGDTHLYVNHLDQVKTQLSREPKSLPKLGIAVRGQNVTSRRHGYRESPAPLIAFEYVDFVLHGYEHHPGIKADVAV